MGPQARGCNQSAGLADGRAGVALAICRSRQPALPLFRAPPGATGLVPGEVTEELRLAFLQQRRAVAPAPVIHSPERKGSWVFSACRTTGPHGDGWLNRFWWKLRAEAELRDVRLHDLRHTHASIALREGETVLAIGRLLGHASPETTLKYTHLSDAMTMEAAEIVGAVLEGN